MRKLRQLPTVRRLKELFKYEDGILYHKTDTTSSWISGGYWNTSVDGINYRTRRLIWKYHHGYDPYVIDHINRIKLDNQIENLRDTSDSTNVFNIDDSRYMNKTGFRCIRKHGNKWRARIFSRKRDII